MQVRKWMRHETVHAVLVAVQSVVLIGTLLAFLFGRVWTQHAFTLLFNCFLLLFCLSVRRAHLSPTSLLSMEGS